jgi:hypothetical protein
MAMAERVEVNADDSQGNEMNCEAASDRGVGYIREGQKNLRIRSEIFFRQERRRYTILTKKGL